MCLGGPEAPDSTTNRILNNGEVFFVIGMPVEGDDMVVPPTLEHSRGRNAEDLLNVERSGCQLYDQRQPRVALQ